VLDSLKLPAWAAQVLWEIKAAAFAELAGVVISKEIPCQPSPAYKGNSLLFDRYGAWDKNRNSSEADPLLPVDLSAELADVPAVNWAAVSADVVLWFSSCAPVGLRPELARFGVWFYQMGEGACFWELYYRQPVTSSCLLALQGLESVPTVIAEQFAATEIGWSWSRNKTASYWKAPALILRSLRQWQEGSAASVQSLDNGNLQSGPSVAAQSTPSNAQMVRFFIRNATRTIYRNIRYRNQDAYWFMAYRTDRKKFVSQTESFHTGGFTVIPAPDGHFYADPFVWTHNGRSFIFFEDYPYREGKGVVSVLEMNENGPAGEARRVLERPYHLSYPFIFEHEGGIYMIPETLDAHRIELYRASHFPDRWELAAVLKENVDAVDTTLWVENGIFYFFTNIAHKGTTPNDLLYLFCADSLTGEWHPHRDNPLSSDVRSSRGAGNLFKQREKLIRPAQDCSVRYGYACQLNEVKVLSPEKYLETPLSRIEPNWMPGLIGTHTINSNEWIEVIDGQIYKKFSSRN
jgi:hypothetical protein